MKCFLTIRDEVWCSLTGLSPEHNNTLVKEFSVFVDGYFFMPEYKKGSWDGKIKFFDKTGKTYIRLLERIFVFLDKWGYEIELTDNRKAFKQPVISGKITKVDATGLALEAEGLDVMGDVILPNGQKFLLRPYQLQCVKTLVEVGSGMCIAGTGAGKTSITAALSYVYSDAGYNVITVVPSTDLVDQTASWYRMLGLETGAYCGAEKDIEKPNVVATWQSLQNNPGVLQRFNVIIWDECVHPETLIDIPGGQIEIKNLKVGDLVKTLNETTKELEYKPIKKVYKNMFVSKGEKIFKFTFDNGKTLTVTGNHKLLTDTGWKRADEITESALLYSTKICKIEQIDYSGDVFNLHVEDNHNYFANGVIAANCHGAKSAVASKLLNDFGKHIAFRFGVTGTLPKPLADQMSLTSSVGERLIEVPAAWLIEHGYLSKIEIQPIELNETFVDENFPDYPSEKAFLSKSPARMEMIADLIISKCAEHGNTLVLTHSIKFGEKLAALIKDAVFLYGDSPSDLRKEHYDLFATRNDLIVIASSGIASTGISIDRVFCLMLVDAGKSYIKAIQSLGRGLRRGHDKDYVYVVDVHSKQKWAKKHYKDRETFYKEAQYPILKKQVLKVNQL